MARPRFRCKTQPWHNLLSTTPSSHVIKGNRRKQGSLVPPRSQGLKWQSWLTTSLSNPKPTIFLPQVTFHYKSQWILPLVGCRRWMANRSSLLWKELVFLRTHTFPLPSLDSPAQALCGPADMVFSPTGCVLVVSVIEQLAQVHNSTIQASMERLCSYLPGKYGKGPMAEDPLCFLTRGSSWVIMGHR